MFAALLAVLLFGVPTRAAAISTSASSAILVDAPSGRVLYAQNAGERRLIASITKLMTALVAVESTPDLDQVMKVPREATLAEGSSMYLRDGEELPLRELLYGLLLASGNDAAVAIAVGCAGDVETFVEWMNLRAESLGMKDSHFVNPNGLNDDAHYSTAYDMSLLAMACMENEAVAEFVGTKSIVVGERSLSNHNKLLWQYDGCVGMKTGYTELAGRTLISAARRDGQLLIAVTLNDRDDWADHAALFDYGFASFPRQTLIGADETYARVPVSGSLVRFVPVRAETAVAWPIAEGETPEARVELPESLTAPIAHGAVVGQISYYLGDTPIGQTYLRAALNVERDSYEAKGLLGRILDLIRGKPSEPFAPVAYSIAFWR